MVNNAPKTAYWTQKTHFLSLDEYIRSSCGYSADRVYKACPQCGSEMTGRSKYDPNWVDEAEIFDIIFDDKYVEGVNV